MSREPSFQFYPGDWLRDANLRRCSARARGVWMDVLCLMFQCEQRGVLATGGEPWSEGEIARALPGHTAENLSGLQELLKNGVARKNEQGAIYSKRMVTDELERAKWRDRQQRHRGSHANVTSSVTEPVTHESRPSSSSSSSSNLKEKTKAPETGASAVELPDWLPVESWNAYLTMRKKIRKPITADGVKLAIRELERLRDAGNDPKAVLERSILNSWQGLFELRAPAQEGGFRRAERQTGNNLRAAGLLGR